MTGRRLRMDRRGMTLVEIMAGFAILAIVVAVSLSIMLFASRVLSGGSARDRMKMLGDEMYSSLNRRLTFSTHVQLLAEGSDQRPERCGLTNTLPVWKKPLIRRAENSRRP